MVYTIPTLNNFDVCAIHVSENRQILFEKS